MQVPTINRRLRPVGDSSHDKPPENATATKSPHPGRSRTPRGTWSARAAMTPANVDYHRTTGDSGNGEKYDKKFAMDARNLKP